MKRENKYIMTIGCLCIAISFLLFGFAALSFGRALTINGVRDVSKPSWDVHIENLDNAVKSGYAEEVFPPKSSITTISNLVISLKNPDDYISYKFKVVNNGEYDAKIGGVIISQPTCVGSGSDANTDAKYVCNNLTYKLNYTNSKEVEVDDLLKAGESKDLTLVLSYATDNTLGDVAKSDVTIDDLKITITYLQV